MPLRHFPKPNKSPPPHATLITRQPALLSSVILTSAARKNLLVPSFLIERIAKSAKQMLHFVQHDIQKSELKGTVP
jgi:hypothetical protein